MVLESVLVYSFTSGWPVFPAPLVNEILFFPLYILASFVKVKVSTGALLYLWAFSSCSGWGLLLVAGHRFLILVASPAAEHRL